MMQTKLTITRPDDWHLHLRDGDLMRSVVGATARAFGRAIVMPNLEPPVTTVAAAAAYRERIAAAIPAASRFAPLLTLYLTDTTPIAEIAQARRSGFVIGVKYYPAGATTNSASGVTAIERVYPVLEAMQKHALPRPPRTSARPSRRSTCSTRAMRCSRAASGRICIACRS